ncbi:PDZ domain [Trinorchestia longiramus]|nr:PDZ domain [Trinorchestia longiramus]
MTSFPHHSQDGEEPPSSDALRSALGQISPTPPAQYSSTPPLGVRVSGATEDESTTEDMGDQPPIHEGDRPHAEDGGLVPTDVQRLNLVNSALHSEDLELLIDRQYSGPLRPTTETAIKKKWARIMGPDMDIVVCQLSKFEWGGGLGVSLEGTVDVEGGKEVRPHHYIRSILPQGPVGRSGVLCSGDELLEVSGEWGGVVFSVVVMSCWR